MGAISRRDQQISEEYATLADSFPASDPPFWTLGREHYHGKEFVTGISESRKTANKEKSSLKRDVDLSEEQRAAVVKILNAFSAEYLL